VGSLPDFLIIGAQKAATTSLWFYLRSHPDVFMPELKEPTFFIREGTWDRGLDWYQSLFAGRRPGQVAGEASPGYTAFPIFGGAAERIARTVPRAKIIYLIREPLQRMVSAWLQARSDAHDDRKLHESLLLQSRYLALSQYATQLERYLTYFDRNQLLVVRTEDLAADPASTILQVCSFLDVDPAGVTADLDHRHNTSSGKVVPRNQTLAASRMLTLAHQDDLAYQLKTSGSWVTHRRLRPGELQLDDDLRQRLQAYLRPEMQRLRAVVGPDLDLWGYA
jgi:hypothetical protein